jgi:hypothetical protein
MKARLLLPILALAFFVLPAHAGTYAFLDPGYKQEVYAVSANALTGFTFAPNGNIWAVQNSPNALIRFDSHSTHEVFGTSVHPIFQSAALGPSAPIAPFWGVTSHPDGRLYLGSAIAVGIADMSTGDLLQVGSLCGGYQLAVDPLLPNHLTSVGNGQVIDIDPASLACTVIESSLSLYFSDVSYDLDGGLAIGQSITQEFCCPLHDVTSYSLTGFGPNYALLSNVAVRIPFSANGIAVFDGMHHVIAALEDGSLIEADLPDNTSRLFASGGFPNNYDRPGGLVRKGPDGALYVLQAGTHYDDGTVSPSFSIVRISQKEIATQPTTWGKVKAAYR